MKEIYVRVFGRVQLVMFRDFAQRKARGLGVTGYVRNLSDGSVEVLAQGEETALASFVEKLHRGPMLARVDNVEVTWRESEKRFEAFDILYTR